MTYAILKKELFFPEPDEADDTGLLAFGGDLSIERLTLAYTKGIFPWYEEGMPVLWWSPDPRMILFPEKMIISHSLKQTIKKNKFLITFDRDFEAVINECSVTSRNGQDGTWITQEMKSAYTRLHKAGLAHSVESWVEGKLVGGLYGVALGKAFFGESMFHSETDASKVALFQLVEKLKQWKFEIIDAQVYTTHLESLGGEMIPRSQYLGILQKAVIKPGMNDSWKGKE